MATMSSVNPATGEVLGRFEELSDAELEARIGRAAQTFRSWRRRPFADRAALLVRAAEVLEQRKEHWGRTMTLEMGKTFKSAVAEAEKCASACRFYAENAERFLADEEVKASPLHAPPGESATRSYVRYLPIGPVLAIMPWNFPFWQVFRFAAPALMAGNVALLKHASNVPQSALAIEEVFRLAGLPDGCFQTLLVGSARVARILEDDRVAAATLTGSEGAGASVASTAGRVIKKTVLELGGSDPFVVMPSAAFDQAVATAVTARCINNGQSCIAAKRFIIHDRIYDRFEREMVKRMQALRVGDPMDPATDVGPLATGAELAKLGQQVDAAVKDGAKLLLGGKPSGGKGFYYPPTVLAGIPRSSPSYREELFGPVAMLYRVKDLDEAIAVANDVPFGLGSSVWTNDEAERRRFVDDIEAGATFINAMVASDPQAALRGREAVRLWPRARPRRHPRVREHQDGGGAGARLATRGGGPDRARDGVARPADRPTCGALPAARECGSIAAWRRSSSGSGAIPRASASTGSSGCRRSRTSSPRRRRATTWSGSCSSTAPRCSRRAASRCSASAGRASSSCSTRSGCRRGSRSAGAGSSPTRPSRSRRPTGPGGRSGSPLGPSWPSASRRAPCPARSSPGPRSRSPPAPAGAPASSRSAIRAPSTTRSGTSCWRRRASARPPPSGRGSSRCLPGSRTASGSCTGSRRRSPGRRRRATRRRAPSAPSPASASARWSSTPPRRASASPSSRGTAGAPRRRGSRWGWTRRRPPPRWCGPVGRSGSTRPTRSRGGTRSSSATASPGARGPGRWSRSSPPGRRSGHSSRSSPSRRRLEPDDRTYLRLVALPCAQALERARLSHDPARTRGDVDETAALVAAACAAAPVPIAILDRELRFVKVNDAFAREDGISADAHVGRSPGDVFRGAPAEALLSAFHEVLATGSTAERDLEAEVPAAPGARSRFAVVLFPVRHRGEVAAVGILLRGRS